MIRTLFAILFLLFSWTPLQQASMKYIADTQEKAIEISRMIIPDGGKPGNICGPLTLSILKDAGLVSPDIPVKSFWFLQPFDKYTQRTILEPAFPKETWHWYFFKDGIHKFDFNRFPLIPGDVLFLPYDYGCGGTFSHIFVVTHMDPKGNPYTVTNHLTAQGWRISEMMLYDRYGEDVGYFDVLTDLRNTNTIGTTGLCGFYLWRMKITQKIPSRIPCYRQTCPK